MWFVTYGNAFPDPNPAFERDFPEGLGVLLPASLHASIDHRETIE